MTSDRAARLMSDIRRARALRELGERRVTAQLPADARRILVPTIDLGSDCRRATAWGCVEGYARRGAAP